ncbi:MAG: hypothetical protein C4583_17930 [Anaerolineaceae bacterium]|nr:MAG: hypothetical protein C4583_17930 [Anaerolineaceae bacterium]
MKRIPWEAILALLLGLALGLGYAWIFSPVRVVDAVPSVLRADFKDQYRAVIAASYAANSDLPRAEARLALLGDSDSYQSLSGQAQRALASGDALQSYQLAQLASALQGLAPTMKSSTPTSSAAKASPVAETAISPVLPSTSTPFDDSILFPEYTPTPRPTRTPLPPPAAPFELLEQEPVCDETLAEGLLQVFTITSNNRRQIPGVELILAWAGGEEHFFTGFKPEIGNGYADATLSPDVIYSLRVASGGTVLTGLGAPLCTRTNGETYVGSLKITFYRP